MTIGTPPRVLFRVAAGPRLGFGHLVRARALARALGIRRPHLALRGPALVERTASRLGFEIVRGTAAELLRRIAPDVLVIDDPSAVAARRWRQPAAALGVPVASVHDGGRAYCGADVSIDGSLVDRRAAGWPAGESALADTRYAILDPRIASARGERRRGASVLIALGGGPRVAVARTLARAIRRRRPDVEVRIAAGFAAPRQRSAGVTWLPPQPGLARELSRCGAAIVGGGVSLYEAAALSTPAVAWPVVTAQHPTVRAFARAGLAVPMLPCQDRAARAARAVDALLTSRAPLRANDARPRIDAKGAYRVAALVRRLARRSLRGAA